MSQNINGVKAFDHLIFYIHLFHTFRLLCPVQMTKGGDSQGVRISCYPGGGGVHSLCSVYWNDYTDCISSKCLYI